MSGFALGVSIVSFHTPRRQLLGLLESLAFACERARAKLPLEQVRISIIDNSVDGEPHQEQFSPGDMRELATSSRLNGCELRLLHGHGNIGYGAAHNLAIRQYHSENAAETRPEYHLLLNPDVEFDPDALAAGLAYLSENPQAVLVSPAASRNGEPQYLCKRYPSLLLLFLRGFAPAFLRAPFARRLAQYEMRDLPGDRPSSGIPIASGCCMLCRSDALGEIGGFDEGFFLYFEDFDLSLRLGRVGRLAHLPAMRIRHEGGGAAGKGLRHIFLFCRSAWRFFHRHGWKWL